MGKKREVVTKKIILLGDQGTGKTTILKNIQNGQNYITEQTTGNKFELKTRKGKTYTRISLWDGIVTGYRTDYRPIAYKNTDLIIIVYSIDSHKSFQNAQHEWLTEAQKFAPGVPIMILGNKTDQRDNNNDCKKLVTYEDGCHLAEQIKAACYLECSAFSESCMDGFVRSLINVTLGDYDKKEKECTLM